MSAMQKIVLPGIVLLLLIATNQMLAQAPQAPTPGAADSPTNSAVTNLLQKAEAGDGDAQVSLGKVYFEGRGVTQDFTEGVKWFRKAAEQGNADGQNNLGVAYVQGKGVPKDGREGATWYRRAADQGHVMAQLNLAQTYNFGLGIPVDFVQSAVWYRKAAEQGLSWAQHDLASAYNDGEGVTKDSREAERWLLKASAQGYAPSTFALGIMYWKGAFGRSLLLTTTGLGYFEKAAAQGYARGAVQLAGLYSEQGDEYIEKDFDKACMWMAVAAGVNQRGHWNHVRPSEATEVEGIGRQLPDFTRQVRTLLTSEQITDCDRQADAWLVANPPPPFGN
jgi:TPR repeat protein